MNELVGKWISDPRDRQTQQIYGRVTQIFKADGRLTYIAHSAKKDEVMLLTYSIDGNCLVTNQPSSPMEHRTPFAFDTEERLILGEGTERTQFIKVK